MFYLKSFYNIVFIERSDLDIEIAYKSYRFGIDRDDWLAWYERNLHLFMDIPRATFDEQNRIFSFGDISRPVGGSGKNFLIRHTSDIYFSSEKNEYSQEISVFVMDDGSCEQFIFDCKWITQDKPLSVTTVSLKKILHGLSNFHWIHIAVDLDTQVTGVLLHKTGNAIEISNPAAKDFQFQETDIFGRISQIRSNNEQVVALIAEARLTE
jgi:hypothetical protein